MQGGERNLSTLDGKMTADKLIDLKRRRNELDRAILKVNERLACKGYPDKADMDERAELYKKMEKVEKALDELRQSAYTE